MITNNIPKYQYIIISANKDRLDKTINLLNKVNKSNATIYNLEATTPENDNNFLTNVKDKFTVNELKLLSCAKSHYRAIEYALNNDSPNYSIILEDDVTFLKDNFCEILEDILNKFENDTKYSNVDFIQIGWIPGNNYIHYKTIYTSFDTINSYENSLVFNCFNAFGLQGYIIKKSRININMNIYSLIKYDNYEDCYNLLKNRKLLNSDLKTFVSDYTIPFLLFSAIIYPPLIIERNEISTIGNNNIYYWDKYFKDYEEEKNKYLV